MGNKLFKNTFFNIIGSFAPMVITIIAVPLYIEQIGEARYGILALIWTLFGYFGFLDLGIGKAVANLVALKRSKQKKNKKDASQIFWTAFTVTIILGLIGSITFYYLGPFVVDFIGGGKNELINEIKESLTFLSLSVPLILLFSLGKALYEGYEDFGILNVIQVTQDILFQVVPLSLAYVYDSNIQVIIIGVIVSKIASTVFIFLGVWYKDYLLCFSFKKNYLNVLIRYGSSVSISKVISPILSSIDRFIIAAISGPTAVTWYTIPFNLSTKINRITSSFARALFPKLSAGSVKYAKSLTEKSIDLTITVITPIVLAGFLITHPFFELWLGHDLAEKTHDIAYIIFFGAWFNNIAFVPSSYLLGQRKPGIVASIHVFELPFFLIVLWFLVNKYGALGAAYAWSTRVIIDSLLMFYFSGMMSRLSLEALFAFLLVTTCFLSVYFEILYSSILIILLILFNIIISLKKYDDELRINFYRIKNNYL